MSYSGSTLDHGEKPSTGWEFLLAFPAPNMREIRKERINGQEDSERSTKLNKQGREEVLGKLRNAKFSYSQIWVPAARMILARVALSEDSLHEIAEIQRYPLQLSSYYGGGYLHYKQIWRKGYVNNANPHFFTSSQRMDINVSAMESASKWGAGINIDELKQNGTLLDAYPLHNPELRENLLKDIVIRRLWDPNFKMKLNRFKDYFGSSVALYFGFFQFFNSTSKALFLVSIPFLFLLGNFETRIISVMQYLFGFIIVTWSALFLKFWRRKNSVLNFEWGHLSSSFDDSFEVRPQFSGIPRTGFYSEGGFVGLEDLDESSNGFASESENEIQILFRNIGVDREIESDQEYMGPQLDNHPIYLYSNERDRRNIIRRNTMITFGFSIAVISFTFLPIMFQKPLSNVYSEHKWSKIVPGVLTGILIFLSEKIWRNVYPTLSDSENHRSNQDYLNSLKIKKFAFEFAANFSSLAYAAFVKPLLSHSDCSVYNPKRVEDCSGELKWFVASIVAVKSIIDCILGIVFPTLFMLINRTVLLMKWWRHRSYALGETQIGLVNAAKEIESNTEADSIKESSLNTFENLIDDYNELVIQFGFISLFGVACPLLPFIILLSNLISQRIDAFKFLYIFNRAPERITTNIGIWENIIYFIIVLSTWTNSWIICITNNADQTKRSNFILFFVTQNILILGVLLIDFLLKDVPNELLKRKSKREYLIARWFGIGEKPYYSRSISLDKHAETEIVRERNTDLKELIESASIEQYEASASKDRNGFLELNTNLRNRLFDALPL